MKSEHTAGLGIPLIIAISVTALLITLIVVDFACCHINQRGETFLFLENESLQLKIVQITI
jgi:hypothetical protein